MWEAFEHAWHEKLDNLIAIIDVNRLGQRGETMHGWDLDSYAKRAEAFGWHAIEIDGHDVEAIDAAYARGPRDDRALPTVIVAKTIKGKGVKAVENKDGFHGKALDDPEKAIEELGGIRNIDDRGRQARGRDEPHVASSTAARSSCRPTRSATTRSRRARPTATRSRRSATGGGTWSRSTARSRTRPTRRSSATRTRTGTSRCTSPSSRWSRRRSGSRCAGGSRSRRRSPRSSRARTTSSGWRRSAARTSSSVGSHAGSLDRRGRAVADGARGSRRVPGGARLDRAVPERREPDGEARRGHGRPRRDRLPAHDPGEHAGHLRSRRGLPGRWRQGRALLGRATTCADRCRDHAARGAEGRGCARRGGRRARV